MIKDQLNNYIDHHKNKRAVTLMIKAVNEIDRLVILGHSYVDDNIRLADLIVKLEKQVEDLQKENTHIAHNHQQEHKISLIPEVKRVDNLILYYSSFVCILFIIELIHLLGIV